MNDFLFHLLRSSDSCSLYIFCWFLALFIANIIGYCNNSNITYINYSERIMQQRRSTIPYSLATTF